jgi:hypothetical protein
MKVTSEMLRAEVERIKAIKPYSVEGEAEGYLVDGLLEGARALDKLSAREHQGSRDYFLPLGFELELTPQD